MRPTGSVATTLCSAFALALGILMSASGVGTVLLGEQWWWQTVLLVVVVLGIAATLRLLLPRWSIVPSAGAAIAWFWLSAALVAPGAGLGGVLPSPATFAGMRSMITQAVQDIYAQGTPASATPGLTALTVLSIGLLAVLADVLVFAVRLPALAGLLFLAVYVTPTLISPSLVDVALFVGVAAAYLLLLWVAPHSRGEVFAAAPQTSARAHESPPRRSLRSPLTAIGLGALALVLAITLPTVTPGLTAASFAEPRSRPVMPSIYSRGVDPTIQLGADLKRAAPVLSLSYSTSANTPLYLKLVDLTDFSDGQWKPESASTVQPVGQTLGDVPGLGNDVARTVIVTSLNIASLRSDWLPLPYPSVGVSGLPSRWLYSPDTLTVTSFDQDTNALGYTVKSLQLAPTAAQLEAAGTSVPLSVQRLTSVPAGTPTIVAATAQQIAGGKTSHYDKAVALQQYFTTSGGFTYSLNAPSEQGYDSSNLLAMAQFLEKKVGYCVHFASTMALMARSLGIPARVAIGFRESGPAISSDKGITKHEVYTDDLHAWPELYFSGIGWLPFEPTPSLGLNPPEYSVPSYATAPVSGGSDPSSGVQEPNHPEQAADATASGPSAASPEVQAQGQLLAIVVSVATGALAVLLLFAPFLTRVLQRRRRMGALASSDSPASIAWQELCDSANDHGLALPPAATPREDADRIKRAIPTGHDAIDRLAREFERETFGRPGAAAEPGRATRIQRDLVRARRALAAGSDAASRRRARFLPVSLLGMRRRARLGQSVPVPVR